MTLYILMFCLMHNMRVYNFEKDEVFYELVVESYMIAGFLFSTCNSYL